MTPRSIAKLGHPILLTRAAPIADPDSAEVQELIDDMRATLAQAQGLGLAAPQVFRSLRLILALPIAERGERPDAEPLALVNPELTPLGDTMEAAFEGCLSIPELRGWVPRYRRVGYRALDRRGRPISGEAEGLFARILQHEVDHLDGILFPMRMSDLRHLAFTDEVHHLARWMAQEGNQA